MKKLISLIFVLATPVISFADTCATGLMPVFTAAQAKEICSTFSAGSIGTLANDTYAVARNAADDANINVWKVDATDDTVLNADTGDVIKLSVAGTSEVQISNDTITFTGAAGAIVPGATSLAIKDTAGSVNNLLITDAGAVTMAGASLGWSYVTGANTACTSTCTFAAVFGVDLAAGASAPVIVGPASATADACVCAGAS